MKGMGRAEGGSVHGERKEARKGTTVDEATSARTEKKRSARGERERRDAASSRSSNSSNGGGGRIYYSLAE